jgi:hypothetical protein
MEVRKKGAAYCVLVSSKRGSFGSRTAFFFLRLSVLPWSSWSMSTCGGKGGPFGVGWLLRLAPSWLLKGPEAHHLLCCAFSGLHPDAL